ncbi:MAG TPA: antibiotic biosynthesis monooxygenase [Chitinophagaceae bacterium]|nr:antibiotic biosynthesis monooxygenase [Chitinophagaceae bacterium]
MQQDVFASYYAVIFTSIRSNEYEGYTDMSNHMMELAAQQPGFLGVESAREKMGITISYWKTKEDILQWKQHSEHAIAQKLGKENWYTYFKVRICKVEREYSFEKNDTETPIAN